MSSARKVAANRINGRRSRGPRTRAGKASSSRNALRHGLAGFSGKNPAVVEKIEVMAKAICQNDGNPLLLEQALLIAENELLMRSVRAERVAVIERLRDGDAIALAKGDNSVALAEARFLQCQEAGSELDRINALVHVMRHEGKDPEQEQLTETIKSVWTQQAPKIRDEYDALREALPDLERLARYERRARSRHKRAFRAFIAIKATQIYKQTSSMQIEYVPSDDGR